MLSERKSEFTKDNIDLYLREIAKEYRKRIGKGMPAELILVGGASVLLNYGFRDMTMDIDALISAASVMKDVISYVGDKFGLPNGWLNTDFKTTLSYTPRLVQFSAYYKSYDRVLTVRTVRAEYLIAMKLRAGRQYKNDLSDILGILADHEKNGIPIQMEQIRKAVCDLYGSWEEIPESSREFIEKIMIDGRFGELYAEVAAGEKEARELLIQVEQNYHGVVGEANAGDIIAVLRRRESNNRTEKGDR